jgi:hypothetical protein
VPIASVDAAAPDAPAKGKPPATREPSQR